MSDVERMSDAMAKSIETEQRASAKRGRPSSYTQEIAEEIIERLANGEPLAVICRDDHMPSWRTVYDWEKTQEGFSAAIAHARNHGHDAIAARTRETARGAGDSTADVNRDKLIIETDLKLLAKWNPRYGDRQQVEHTGGVTMTMAPLDDQI